MRKGTVGGHNFGAPSSIISQGSSIFRNSFVNIGSGRGLTHFQMNRETSGAGSVNVRLSGLQPFKQERNMSFRAREASVKNMKHGRNSITGLTAHPYLNEQNQVECPIYNPPEISDYHLQNLMKSTANNIQMQYRKSQEQFNASSKTLLVGHAKTLKAKQSSLLGNPTNTQSMVSLKPADEKTDV